MSEDLQQTEDITELVKALDAFHQEVAKIQKKIGRAHV